MNLRGTPSLECTGSERYDMYIDRASAYAKAHERALAASMRESAEGALAAIATSKVPPPSPPMPPWPRHPHAALMACPPRRPAAT